MSFYAVSPAGAVQRAASLYVSIPGTVIAYARDESDAVKLAALAK